MNIKMTISWIVMYSSIACAQGMLPPSSTSTAQVEKSSQTILIGDVVPKTLTVTDADEKTRELLTYKTPLEVMVLGFFSVHCSSPTAIWPELRRFHEMYKGWKVAFVAVSVMTQESRPELEQRLKTEHIPWATARDERKTVAKALHISGTPEFLIIDEYGILRYRGPLSPAWKALSAVIGHTDVVDDPEPPMTGVCPLE